jgi:hypothetical protein
MIDCNCQLIKQFIILERKVVGAAAPDLRCHFMIPYYNRYFLKYFFIKIIIILKKLFLTLTYNNNNKTI